MLRINLKLYSVMANSVTKTLVVAAISATATAASAGAMAFAANAATSPITTTTDGNGLIRGDLVTGVTSIKGLDDLKGLTEEQVKALAVEEGTYDETDMSRIVFLYNVKKQQFIHAGGYWGTHVSLRDYPMALWVNKGEHENVQFAQDMDTGEGHLLGWRETVINPATDEGVFIDRNSPYGWKFKPVGDSKNTYRIYTYIYNNSTLTSESYKRYLCATEGDGNQEKRCEGLKQSEIDKAGLAGYDEWRVFTMEQINNLQRLNTDNMTSSLDLSYKLLCPGFSRGSKNMSAWKTVTFGQLTNGGMRFGLEKAYNLTPKTSSDDFDSGNRISITKPYTFDGTKYTSQDDYLRHVARLFCADAKNVRGVIYQDVKVTRGGSYVVECKGFSNTTKAKRFAVRFDMAGNEVPHTLHQTMMSQTSYMSASEKEALHISEQNMDYAGKCFYSSHKYINSVLVQVPELKEGEHAVIRFGVIVGDDANDTTPVTGEWTVIDDFRLLYASRVIDEDLILDEERKDLEYLTSCSNNYRNKVLHLKKTFTKDKWNSFVLPVNLTCDQFRQAFGANARLAVLSSLTDNAIQFTSVNTDEKGPKDVVLEAYKPYIIFPTKHVLSKGSPAYKALLTETDGESKSHVVVVDDNHIDIPNVTMATNDDNKNDLSNLDTNTWTTKQMYSVVGNGTMEAHGTFARTFGTADKQQLENENADDYGRFTFLNRDIIPGRDNLIGSFFFDNGNMYCSTTRPRGLRGFSCWFKPTGGTLVKAMRLYLDGVADGTTTGIDSVIDFGENQPTGKAAQGIYTVNGQLVSNGSDTTGLPAGMYIVNGKKCVVK